MEVGAYFVHHGHIGGSHYFLQSFARTFAMGSDDALPMVKLK